MARKPRIEYPGALYHVMTRGNRRELIFRDARDRERFLEKLLEYKERYGFDLYAYVLMGNHVHLLIETGNESLSRIMQGLLQSYTQWYNRKYRTVGHLFQGRYRAILCDKNNYLLSLIRYIHLNPIRAGIVKNPSEYKWSSHREYLGLEISRMVEIIPVLSQFSTNIHESIRMYESFVLQRMNEGKREDFYRTIDQRFLGETDFVEEVKRKIGEESQRRDNILKDKTLEEMAAEVKELTGIAPNDLRGRSRREDIVEARSLFVRLSLMYTQSKRKKIAEYLGREPKMISYLERKLDDGTLRLVETKLRW